MARFQYCLKIVLGHEGGLSDHKADRGGRTNFGITQQVYDDYRKLIGLPARKVDEIHQSEVEAIYNGYWRSSKAGLMPEPLDLLMFDAAVNHGAKRAIKLLQRVLGIPDDGIWGPQSHNALQEEIASGNVADMCAGYLAERRRFYDRIIMNDPTQAVFAKGWGNRVDNLEKVVTA